MRHHGVMVTGPSIALAFDDLYFLERTAQVQLLAESGRAPLLHIPQDIARQGALQMRPIDADRIIHFEALKQLFRSEERKGRPESR
jgi:ribulose-5-phosphate 4-epimerase/fuculose-1-phosphate aldolase